MKGRNHEKKFTHFMRWTQKSDPLFHQIPALRDEHGESCREERYKAQQAPKKRGEHEKPRHAALAAGGYVGRLTDSSPDERSLMHLEENGQRDERQYSGEEK